MDTEEELLVRIKISTKELKADIIQELLLIAKRNMRSSGFNPNVWDEVAETLWLHLHSGLEKFDDQLLCATCFYTILMLANNDRSSMFISEVKQIIDEEIHSRESLQESSKLPLATSLMYGLFQSAYLIRDGVGYTPGLIALLQSIVRLLTLMAYEYSRYTFMAFKTISAFKKLIGKDLQHIVLSNENKIILLNLVNHNWENPVTGVRDLNKDIFHTLVSVLDENLYAKTLVEINAFYWNKAKYLMLAEIIDQCNVDLSRVYRDDWIDGLVNSLHKTGLVSAGADMYYAILKKLKFQEEWCAIFLDKITEILGGNTNKPIENFYNYWCLPTLKKFNSLKESVLEKLNNVTNEEQRLFSTLYLIKQANRLGLVNKSWGSIETLSDIERMVIMGIENCNNQVRMLAFEILSVSHTKTLPTRMEYRMVLDYIEGNINSDCTVLRLSMLNAFGTFLTHAHITFLNSAKNISDTDIENLREFCDDFQELLKESLTMQGNYQRKIASIKLIKVFFCSLNEVPRKRQKQIKHSAKTLIETLTNKKQWALLEPKFVEELLTHLNDPAEDIRDNITDLLISHYDKELQDTEVLNSIIENALKSMKCKFFHEINCGQSMFKLLTSLLIKEKSTTKFKSVEDIFEYAYSEIMSEFKLKRSILDSIDKGKQLYSFMSILQVVLEVCKQKKYDIDILKFDLMEFLLALNDISNQFALENETTTSSDFSKMSDMVEHIIANSECGQQVQSDDTQISNLHQLVLNCLWLNVKGSCDLSSLFIQFLEDSQTDISEKCLHIITHVLETCRHKGAIEAAGSALGQAIRHLTTLPENSKLSKLPYSLLEHKLKELISEAGEMASVTRRGAGLSIMVHRIVSSDMRKEKPLFHYFMKILLQICKKTEDFPTISDIDNEKDLPKAIYIHFLTRIVMDSSLASDMMFYSAKLAELAFENLTSPYWQIRNAALQLYGALIPKLIGQKKASGTDDETIATVACDELRTHSPQLWRFILEQLRKRNHGDKLQHHSNLVPILNMIANAAKRYNFSSDLGNGNDLLDPLLALLDSPIYTVRRLSAKCIYNIYEFVTVYKNLVKAEIISENFCHGCLLLIMHYYNGHKKENVMEIRKKFYYLKEKFSLILKTQDHSYVSKLIFDKIFDSYMLDLETLKSTLNEMRTKKHSPGVFLWANQRIERILMNIHWNDLPNAIEYTLSFKGIEDFCKILLVRIENEQNIPENIIKDIANILLQYDTKLTSDVWEILYKITLKVNIHELIDIRKYLDHWNVHGVTYRQRYLLPLMAKISSSLFENQEEIAQIIFNLTNPENSDVDMRYIAAIANNELANNNLPASGKVITIKSTLILLQDEDEDVRNEAAKFFRQLAGVESSVHPHLCLKKILTYEFLCTILDGNEICILQEDLSKMFLKDTPKCNSSNQYNPFANDSKNIYFEIELYSQLVANLKSNLCL